MSNYANGLNTRNLVLKAARELFYENGYVNTSFSQICQKAGLNSGLVVYHFGGKAQIAHDIYQSVIQSQCDPLYNHYVNEDKIVLSILSLYTHYYLFFKDAKFRRFSAEVNAQRIAGDTHLELAKTLPLLYEGALKYHDSKKLAFFFAADVGLGGDIETFLCEHPDDYTLDECVKYTTELYLPYIQEDFLKNAIARAKELYAHVEVSNQEFDIVVEIHE